MSSNVYGSKWRAARTAWLREHPLCEMCRRAGQLTEGTVVDHKTPHRLRQAQESGDARAIQASLKLFWSRSNWQTLCAAHHDATKQRSEHRGYEAGCNEDGMPVDPGHHWHAPGRT